MRLTVENVDDYRVLHLETDDGLHVMHVLADHLPPRVERFVDDVNKLFAAAEARRRHAPMIGWTMRRRSTGAEGRVVMIDRDRRVCALAPAGEVYVDQEPIPWDDVEYPS